MMTTKTQTVNNKHMIATKSKTVNKNKKLLSSQEVKELKEAAYELSQGSTNKYIWTLAAMLNRQVWCACIQWNVIKQDNYKEINFDRLKQMAFATLEGEVKFTMSTTDFGNNYLQRHYKGLGTTSHNSWLKGRGDLGDTHFEEIDPDYECAPGEYPKMRMVLNDKCNPLTGEFEEKCIKGLGIYKIVQPVSKIVIGKDGTEKPAGITVAPATYEEFRIDKALVVFRTLYRILEERYNKKHKYNPAVSFYDTLPSHKCNFMRNLWNAFNLGIDDFEGNLYSDEDYEFTFQYPETLVERVVKGFIHVWKETFKISEELWNKLEPRVRAIPSWRRNSPYSEVSVDWGERELEFS